jgi:transposase
MLLRPRLQIQKEAERCVLLITSRTSSMDKSGDLNDFEHRLVIVCNTSNKSVRNTATLLNLPKSAVGDVIVKWKREGTTTTKPWPGKPRLMTDKKVVRETR